MSKFHTLFALSVATLILTGCGGGGSEPAATQKNNEHKLPVPTVDVTLSLSTPIAAITLDELTQSTIILAVNYNGAGTLRYSSIDEEAITTTLSSDNAITITAVDLDVYQASTSITVTVTDGTLIDSVTVDVLVKNTSLEADMSQLQAALDTTVQFAQTDVSANNIITYLVDVGMLLGNDTNEAASDLVQRLVTSATFHQSDYLDAITTISSQLRDTVKDNSLTQSTVSTWRRQAQDDSARYASAMSDVFSQAALYTEGLLPSLTPDSVHVQNGMASLFIGDARIGNQEGADFVFNDAYAFLEALINANAPLCTNINDNQA